jgi:FAD:protein FMN transferase
MIRLWKGLSCLLGTGLLVFARYADDVRLFEDSRISMACTYGIVAYGRDDQAIPRFLSEALDEVDRIDRLMSNYKPESPLSEVNRDAGKRAVRVSPELFDFLAECLRYSRESEGAFDITVGPLMKTWGFFRGEGRIASDSELAAARSRTGYRHVILNARDSTVQFDRDGMEFDLGGIAKGYAVDRVILLLKARGVERALVSAGGSTIYGLGTPPGKEGWPVRIDEAGMQVTLKDRALSIAGSSEKFFEVGGVRYSHIMDPRTGRPAQTVLSVAVLTGNGTAGDALDDVFYVQGVDWSRRYLDRIPGTEAYFFLPDGKVTHLP